jgi:hypothetical protein
MNNSIQTLISEFSTKLTGRAKDELSRLMASKEAEAFLAADSNSIQKERAALVKALRAVPGKHAAAKQAASKVCADAGQRVRDAQQALQSANEQFVAATARGLAAASGEADEQMLIESELRESADPRLLSFSDSLRELAQVARHCVAWSPTVSSPDLYGNRERGILTNAAEVNGLFFDLQKTSATALEMQLVAQSSSDFIEWLQVQIDRLAPALRSFQLDSLLVRLDASGSLVQDRGLTRYEASDAAIAAHGGEPERNIAAMA